VRWFSGTRAARSFTALAKARADSKAPPGPPRPETVCTQPASRREVIAVRELRLQYPRMGKDKLAGQEVPLSVSMVGRILRHLRATGQLTEPGRATSGARMSPRVSQSHRSTQ
jgi:hypothetical protein